MADCNVNNLLASGKCFAAVSEFAVSTANVEQWCLIGNDITVGVDKAWFNPDVNAPWYNTDAPGIIVNPDI